MPTQKEIQTNCEHDWLVEMEARYTVDGYLPALWKCQSCELTMSVSEAIQLETLKNLKGVQKKIAVTTIIISLIAVFISIVALVSK